MRACICMWACMWVYAYNVCLYVGVSMCVHAYACVYVYVCLYVGVSMCVHAYVCGHACVYVYVCLYVGVPI